MNFKKGIDRTQIFLFTENIDQLVSPENEVRLIEEFVEGIDVKEFGFLIKESSEGASAYHPKDLLKLYIYGYKERIRSSRQLERECKRNTEVMWLLKTLKPDHNTISNFRRDNSEAIKKVFQHTVKVAEHFNLIGKKLIAGDSTKLRAQNSRKNNFNKEKIEQHLKYISNKLDEYNKELEEADDDDQEETHSKIKKHVEQKVKYEKMHKQLQESAQTQISTSDPDSRLLTSSNNAPEVSYNIQATVDAEHFLPIDYEVTNENDKKAMGVMVERAEAILETNQFTALYDKGYYSGSQLQTAQQTGATVIVDVPELSSKAPDAAYNVENFTYNEQEDTYTCPQGKVLTTTGTSYPRRNNEDYKAKQYRTKACSDCAVKNLCTKSKTGRVIERGIYATHFEQNARNLAANQQLYKQRKCIVEHPFGTIKRQWGFHYLLTKKGKKRASADVGLMFIAYNLRRIFNIIGKKELMQYLQVLTFFIFMLRASIKAAKRKIKNFIYELYHMKSYNSATDMFFPKRLFKVNNSF